MIIDRLLRLPLLCALMMAFSAWGKGDLGEDLKTGGIWQVEFDNLAKTYLQGERGDWVDQEKTTLRLPKPKITIGSLKLGETLINWKEGTPSSIQIMLYNKGDNGAINRERFEARLEENIAGLNEVFGAPGKPVTPNNKEVVVKNLKMWQWKTPGCIVTLDANSTGGRKDFEAEFIRLRVFPPEGMAKSARATKKDLKSNVKREGKRVVIEGIPMVDQGQKGYCSVATAARVFGYYGSEHVDQHELASAADTGAEGGTSVDNMVPAIKKIGSKFQVRINMIQGSLDSVADYQRLIKSYNREAKRMGKKQFPDNVRNVSVFWDMADADALKAVRCRPADVEKWMKPVRTYIDNGIPVIWSLYVGIVPEPMMLPQSRGGHMRLIIGYDDEKKTILFSDSWGKEHTCKEMPVVDAAAVTTTRLVMAPSK